MVSRRQNRAGGEPERRRGAREPANRRQKSQEDAPRRRASSSRNATPGERGKGRRAPDLGALSPKSAREGKRRTPSRETPAPKRAAKPKSSSSGRAPAAERPDKASRPRRPRSERATAARSSQRRSQREDAEVETSSKAPLIAAGAVLLLFAIVAWWFVWGPGRDPVAAAMSTLRSAEATDADRKEAAKSLINLGPRAAEKVAFLAKSGQAPESRPYLAMALGAMARKYQKGINEATMLSPLAEMTTDEAAEVRSAAVRALAGCERNGAAVHLLAVLQGPHGDLHKPAAEGLVSCQGPAAVKGAILAAQHHDVAVREIGRGGLSHTVLPEAECLRPLMDVMEQEDNALATLARQVFTEKAAETPAVMTAELLSPAPKLAVNRAAVIAALATAGGVAAQEAVKKHLDDPSVLVRREAIAAVGKLRMDDAVAVLKKALLRDPDEGTRVAAAEAMAAVPGEEAREALLTALRDAGTSSRVLTAVLKGMQGQSYSRRIKYDVAGEINALHDHPDSGVRGEVYRTLKSVTNKDKGRGKAAWSAWLAKKKREAQREAKATDLYDEAIALLQKRDFAHNDRPKAMLEEAAKIMDSILAECDPEDRQYFEEKRTEITRKIYSAGKTMVLTRD